MADAERIPIVMEQPAEGRGNETVRDDGTLVIDLMADQECTDASSTSENLTIDVCAERQAAANEEAGGVVEAMHKALNAKIGPVEIGSIKQRDGTYSFGLGFLF